MVRRFRRFFRMLTTIFGGSLRVLRRMGSVVFVKLLGAIRTFEFMAFTGNPENGYGHKEDGEKTFIAPLQ